MHSNEGVPDPRILYRNTRTSIFKTVYQYLVGQFADSSDDHDNKVTDGVSEQPGGLKYSFHGRRGLQRK